MSERVHRPVRLPMYDWPEVRDATAGLEHALDTALTDALGLNRKDLIAWSDEMGPPAMWLEPGMLLTQTCGYPLTHTLKGKVQLVGVPHYSAEGCEGPRYCSQLIVSGNSSYESLEDLRGKRAAFNSLDSQSGMNALRHAVAVHAGGSGYFSEVIESGSHLKSMQAVAEGRADIGSIDAVCWALACQELPELTSRLRSIGQTASAPGLPLITSIRFSETDVTKMTEAVKAVLSDPLTASWRRPLGITGFSKVTEEDYEPILAMEREAARLGYPELA